MPDVQEVFRMSTQKVRQDPGAMDRQHTRQRRVRRNRKIGAFAVVGCIVAAVIVAIVVNVGSDDAADGTMPATVGTAEDLAFGTYLLDLGSGELTPIEGIDPDSDPDVSADGTRIAFELGDVHVANIDGTEVQRFETTGLNPVDEGSNAPRWSPDGRTLVFQVDGRNERIGNLFSLDVASGEMTQLTDLEQTSSHLWYMSPSYSPDGGSILFTSPRGSCGSCTPSTGKSDRQVWHLWSIPSSGGEPTIVVRDAGLGEYSPDGSMIAYTQISGTEAAFDGTEAALNDLFTGDLWIANADGSDRRQLVAGELVLPRWSPDGTKITYSDDGGTYVVDVGTGETTMIADAAGWAEWVDNDTLLLPMG